MSGHLDIVARALGGGAVIGLLLALARGRHYVLAGLLVSIPAISLYTWWWIGTEHGPKALKESVHAAIWSAVPWVAYLCVVYLTAGRAPLWLSLALGFLTWLVCAVIDICSIAARAVGKAAGMPSGEPTGQPTAYPPYRWRWAPEWRNRQTHGT